MSDIIVLAAGERAIRIAENVRTALLKNDEDFTLVNARFLKPLDEELLEKFCGKHVITVEDNAQIGGFGDAISRFYRGSDTKVHCLAYRDAFIPHGEAKALSDEFGVSEEKLLAVIGEIHARR